MFCLKGCDFRQGDKLACKPGTQCLIGEQAELKYRTSVLLIDLVPGGLGIMGSVGDGLGSLHK